MNQEALIPVILSGGSGTRLWPVSRREQPKQLQALVGDRSMLAVTVGRLDGLANVGSPMIVCARAHHDSVVDELNGREALVITEPIGRNTAPAAAAAALAATRHGADPILALLPADHVLADAEAFRRAVDKAAQYAADGHLVAFGIVAVRPETGYGYIRSGETIESGVRRMEAFVEKPDRATARQYIADGNHSWNSGMFVFRASRYLAELERLAPDILEATRAAFEQGVHEGNAIHLAAEAFAACRSDSIDYAVMEHTSDAVVVRLDAGWSDVGSWAALLDVEAVGDDNVTLGDVVAIGASGNYLRADHRLLAVADIEGMVVVETADAVLVLPRTSSQRVKDIVAELEAADRPEVQRPTSKVRPWGRSDLLDSSPSFDVRRVEVQPDHDVSLQSPPHRAEVCIVTAGVARVTMDGSTVRVAAGETFRVPKGARFCLAGDREPVVVVRVQLDADRAEHNEDRETRS
jgi:mannose-1-phosphate guanylyltransferase/mannose-6-phosphate isomerase